VKIKKLLWRTKATVRVFALKKWGNIEKPLRRVRVPDEVRTGNLLTHIRKVIA